MALDHAALLEVLEAMKSAGVDERIKLAARRSINGIIELHRRIARGFRNPANYRLRMILAAGRLTHPNLR